MNLFANHSTEFIKKYISNIDLTIAESKENYVPPVNVRTGKRPKNIPMPWMTKIYEAGKEQALLELRNRQEAK
jgi:hypothetical protein